MSKKVIPVICEGQSDLIALESYLDNLFSNCDVKFVIASGDFLGDETKSDKYLDELVEDAIFNNDVMNIDFTVDDILMVGHLIDTDGIFEEDSILLLDKNKNHTKYYDHNIVVCNNVQRTIETRELRRDRINESIKRSSVTIKGKTFPYSIYYMSVNLEDVTSDAKNTETEEEKISLAEQFSIKFEKNEEFIEFLKNNNASKTEDHKTSWDFIRKHSLEKSTNLIIFINKVNEILYSITNNEY